MAPIKEASTPKDTGSENGGELQGRIVKLKHPEPRVTKRKEMNSSLMQTNDQPSQAHGIQIKTFKSVLSAEKEANTPKDAGSESGADLQKIIAEFKPPDPTVNTRNMMNSDLMKKHDKPIQDHSIFSKTFLPP